MPTIRGLADIFPDAISDVETECSGCSVENDFSVAMSVCPVVAVLPDVTELSNMPVENDDVVLIELDIAAVLPFEAFSITVGVDVSCGGEDIFGVSNFDAAICVVVPMSEILEVISSS